MLSFLGYNIIKSKNFRKINRTLDYAIKHILNKNNPIIIDVGAHEGESIVRFNKIGAADDAANRWREFKIPLKNAANEIKRMYGNVTCVNSVASNNRSGVAWNPGAIINMM